MSLNRKQIDAPFLKCGARVSGMAMWTLLTLALLFGAYSWRYEPIFFLKFLAVIGVAIGLEVAYVFLRDGRFGWVSGSSAVTAAILLAGIPTNMPLLPLFYSLVVAILIVKLPLNGKGLALNPALVGRLFLMLAFNAQIVDWTAKTANIDGLTTATPMDVYHSEETVYAMHNIVEMATGKIGGVWEDLYLFVPNGPGEMFGPLILLLGFFLWWKGILDWRPGLAFLISFAVVIGVLSVPIVSEFVAEEEGAGFVSTLLHVIVFNVLGGAILFSAVFIAGDPKSMPISKSGKLVAGILAGIINAVIRHYTFYSEAIVYSFLIVNLLSPLLDRLSFAIRGHILARRQNSQQNL